MERGLAMFDRESRRSFDEADFAKYRFAVGRCDVVIFISHHEPRAFVGGGEFGYDSVVRPVDAVEAEALAERFGLPELADVARRMPPLG
jgi:hypothetical protein